MDGLTIDSLVVGGPAFRSGQLGQGDLVLAIDRQPVDPTNVLHALRGSDRPGSTLQLTVRCAATGETRNVVLTRMRAAAVAERSATLELLKSVRVRRPDSAPRRRAVPKCPQPSSQNSRRLSMLRIHRSSTRP